MEREPASGFPRVLVGPWPPVWNPAIPGVFPAVLAPLLSLFVHARTVFRVLVVFGARVSALNPRVAVVGRTAAEGEGAASELRMYSNCNGRPVAGRLPMMLLGSSLQRESGNQR